MFAQIEVTTKCNFRCFYCAGRHMPQKHMPMELFDEIMGKLPRGRYVVSLQGEGEPMVHPQFWEMVERVKTAGKVPYTITNGSLMDAERIRCHFPVIGVSLDSMDPAETARIGRKPVLDEFESLLKAIGPARVIVHTVDYGQTIAPLRVYLRRLNVHRHVVQPLQQKTDYARHYQKCAVKREEPTYHYSCRHLQMGDMVFWNVDGRSAPCSYIKDASLLEDVAEMKAKLGRGVVPRACARCREMVGPSRVLEMCRAAGQCAVEHPEMSRQ